MAKLDGMDPKLVRELLREVQQAGREIQDVEARVTGVMRQAGVAAHVTYRPAQVADDCTSMVKDVTGRLAVLEKKEKQRGGNGKPAENKGQKFYQEPDITMPADDPKPEDHKSNGAKPDHKPEPKGDHKPDHKAEAKSEHKPEPKADHKPDPKADDHRAHDKAATGNGAGTHSAADDAKPAKGGEKNPRVAEGSLSQPPPTADETARTGQATVEPVGQPVGQPATQPSVPPADPHQDAAGNSSAYGTGTTDATSPATGAGTGVGASADGAGNAMGNPGGDASAAGGTATCQCVGMCRCGMANGTGTAAMTGAGGVHPGGGGADAATTGGVVNASYTDAGQGTAPAPSSGTAAAPAAVPSANQVPDANQVNQVPNATDATAGGAPGTGHVAQDVSGTTGVPVRDDSQIFDTLGKDHPDDIDQTAGRQVMVVDGVKVVSTPMNMPGVADTQGAGAQPASMVTGPHPDGPPGFVEPLEPAHSGSGQHTGSGHVGGPPVGNTGSASTASGHAAYGNAISGNSGHSVPAPGQSELAPGDPMGDYVGTPADNVTEDPYATGDASSAPGTPEDQDRPLVVEVHLATPDDAGGPGTSGDRGQREVTL
ncbi:hypothetical protein [Sphaerimonospora thailandensis]|uniref:Uncharacterized protein n=1 Tax=Sphaerimonospora thailandensis TaxID=795644 RepID=A0A8J3R8P8_9ACTN|nr:hypothetical protein [Sphaerimonospora thailandensis]GIH70523.1 hypothetical protein Mth01_27760 [Sphaerimonospora thailandensis]